MKTARTYSLTGKNKFDAEEFIELLKIKIRENPKENIILDITRLVQSDINSIYNRIQKKLVKEGMEKFEKKFPELAIEAKKRLWNFHQELLKYADELN